MGVDLTPRIYASQTKVQIFLCDEFFLLRYLQSLKGHTSIIDVSAMSPKFLNGISLTHFRLNKLIHTIYWKSLDFSFRNVRQFSYS